MRIAPAALALSLVVAAAADAQQPAAPIQPRPGRYAVGYRLAYAADSTRTWGPRLRAPTAAAASAAATAPAPRRIPVRLWYPAVTVRDTARSRYEQYLDVRADTLEPPPVYADSLRDRTLDILRYAARKYAGAGGTVLAAEDTAGLVARLLAMPVRAMRNARPSPGRFPVIVFAGGAYHSVDENVVLWENLASHGYIVAAIPSLGIGEPNLPADDAGLETMARDIETVVAWLGRIPSADRTRLGAAGFSFGGAAALVAGARNAWVDAVAGLDASFIAGMHRDRIRRSALLAPDSVTVPVLELHRADTTVDHSLLDSLRRAPRYSVELSALDHVDFNSYVLLYRGLLSRGVPRAERDSALASKAAAYAGMVDTIREYFDIYVRGDRAPAAVARMEAAMATQSARWRGVSPGVRVQMMPAETGPPAGN